MPLSVLLNAEVIQAVNDAITSGLRANPGRGQEVGGILLGRVEYPLEARPIIHIQKLDPIESEYRRGPSLVLSDKDKRALGRQLARWNRKRKDNLQPVGLFRSHTRRGLYLDNDDFSVIQAYFPEQYSVFLLVRPVPGAARVGGFFFWEEGDIHRESSYLEFPFDPARLPLVGTVPVAEPRPSPAAVERPPSVVEPQRPVTIAPPPAQPQVALTGLGAAGVKSPPPAPPAVPGNSQPIAAPPRAPLVKVPATVPTWLRFAIPIAAGFLLGAALYEGRTLMSRRAAAPIVRPAPLQTAKNQAAPAISTPAPSAQPAAAPSLPAQPIEKPSPFKPKQPLHRAATSPVKAPPVAMAEVEVSNPAGSASREDSTRAEAPLAMQPAIEQPAGSTAAQIAHAAAPPPLPSITTPARVEHPRMALATVTIEPVSESKLGRVVGKIPGLRRFDKKNKGFIPARPIREIAPAVPSNENLVRDVPVDLRVTVNTAGSVSNVEPASRASDKRLLRLAEDAARNWQFEPARRNDETVTSEMILHFTFKRPVKAAP